MDDERADDDRGVHTVPGSEAWASTAGPPRAPRPAFHLLRLPQLWRRSKAAGSGAQQWHLMPLYTGDRRCRAASGATAGRPIRRLWSVARAEAVEADERPAWAPEGAPRCWPTLRFLAPYALRDHRPHARHP